MELVHDDKCKSNAYKCLIVFTKRLIPPCIKEAKSPPEDKVFVLSKTDASVASCGARFAELATPLPLPASSMVWSVVSVSARTLDTATLVRLYFLLVGIFSTRVTLPSPVPISLRILWLQTVWYQIHPIWNPPHSRTVAIVPNRSDCKLAGSSCPSQSRNQTPSNSIKY